ncbi:hypothetical protein L2E82_51625 [Cichorium intybus]|nr:hypothetical protein L2E82_51625 [Cichorium intybus]
MEGKIFEPGIPSQTEEEKEMVQSDSDDSYMSSDDDFQLGYSDGDDEDEVEESKVQDTNNEINSNDGDVGKTKEVENLETSKEKQSKVINMQNGAKFEKITETKCCTPKKDEGKSGSDPTGQQEDSCLGQD